MKRNFITICILSLFLLCGIFIKASAATLNSTLSTDKPFALLIYTSWSNYNNIYATMKKLQTKYPNYNFVRVNLNDEEAAALFNGYIIIKHIPTVILGKQGGKFNQLIDNSCAADYACMSGKLKRFAK